MEKDNSFDIIGKIITTIRANLEKFSDSFSELSRQLYSIENMRLAHIPKKYILQSLLKENGLVLLTINKTADLELLQELNDRLLTLDIQTDY